MEEERVKWKVRRLKKQKEEEGGKRAGEGEAKRSGKKGRRGKRIEGKRGMEGKGIKEKDRKKIKNG